MADNEFSERTLTYVGQNAGNGDRRLAKDILLKLDSRFSKALKIYNKYIPSEDSCSYCEVDFNQNRATAMETDVLSYSQGRSSILSISHPSNLPIGSENRGGSVTTDLHQTEYIDELQTGKKVAYSERIPITTSHHGDQTVGESRPSQSVYSVEPNTSKQVASKTSFHTPLEHPNDPKDLHPKSKEVDRPVIHEPLKSKSGESNQPKTQTFDKAASEVPDRTLNKPFRTERQFNKPPDVKPQYKRESPVNAIETNRNKSPPQSIPPSVTKKTDGSAKTRRINASPAKTDILDNQMQRKVLTETSRERRAQSPTDLVTQAKIGKPVTSSKQSGSARPAQAAGEMVEENTLDAKGLTVRGGSQNRTRPGGQSKERRRPESPGFSSPEPRSPTDRMTADDNDNTSTYFHDGQSYFLSPDPSAMRDLDTASPEVLDLCDRHAVHYCFFVYFSSATVDEDMMPFRRKSFMEKLAAMKNREDIQHMLSTKCGRDAYSDRRVIAIERQSGTEVRLSDLDPDTAFIKGLPRRRITIGGPSFAHISCAISLFEALLPNVIRSAIFPYRLPQGSSTRYSAGDRISSTHNWENGRAVGTVYLRKQFDDKGGWKSFIPYSKSEMNA